MAFSGSTSGLPVGNNSLLVDNGDGTATFTWTPTHDDAGGYEITFVVDDSALFRHLIRDVLKEIPEVSVIGNAENGRQALDQIRERRPDLITLDVEMPDLNGIEVLRELRRKGDSTPAIMVSRLTENGAQITTDALLEGAFDFVLKPSGSDPLANKLELQLALAEKLNAFQLSRASITRENPTAS